MSIINNQVIAIFQGSNLISDNVETELPLNSVRPLKRGPICFNCDGSHALRECKQPRDAIRIAEQRRNFTKVG